MADRPPATPDRRRLRELAILFTTLAAALIVADVLWGFPPRDDGYWIGRDFVNMWLGARIAAGGDLAGLFDWPTYVAHLRAVAGPDYPLHNWSYPPQVLLFTFPLAALDYGTALVVWHAAGFLAYLLAVRALLTGQPSAERGTTLLLAAVAPGAVANVVFGQVGLFAAAAFVGGLALRDRRPILAGLLFGLLTMKPQLGFVLPLLLLAERRATVVASAAATAAALALAASAVFGWSAIPDYVAKVLPVQTAVMMSAENLESMVPTPFVAVRALGLPAWTGWIAFAATAPIAAAAVVVLAIRRAPRTEVDLAAATAVFLLTPYAFVYDMALMAPFLALRLAEGRMDETSRLATTLALLAPYLCAMGAGLGLPLATLIVLALLADVWRRHGSSPERRPRTA